MRIAERTEALCELGRAPLPTAHIAQVDEERHGGVVVDRTCRADECVDPLPRLKRSPLSARIPASRVIPLTLAAKYRN